MKLIKTCALFLLLFIMFMIPARANECASNWYIKKNGRNTPIFPDDSDFLDCHNGYYVGKGEDCKKKIFLTFDAGYENGNIEKILDVLKEENVPAAFFILKNLIYKNTDLVKRMAEEGHLVCNHTKNHKDMTTLTAEEMKANLKFLEDLYNEYTGKEMAKYFRFPEGRYNCNTILTAEEAGYKTVFWSLAYADWDDTNQPSEEKAIKILTDNIHDGAIVLLHPTSRTNARILKTMIKTWRDMGYSFGTLDEL